MSAAAVQIPRRARLLLEWQAVKRWGVVRRRSDGRLYLQFGRVRIYSDRGDRFADEDQAKSTLAATRRFAQEKGKQAALERLMPTATERNQCRRYLALWLEETRAAVRAGELGGPTLRERERWCREDATGYIGAWWGPRSVHAITAPECTAWVHWLAEQETPRGKPLRGKTRWNVAAAFHRFCGWLVEQEVLERVPPFRWPRKDRRVPVVVGEATQEAILAAIPEEARGLFLCMARLGIRPSEAVELRWGDLRDGWLHVSRAKKDRRLDAPVRGTKTGQPRALPVPGDLAAWLEKHGPGHHKGNRGQRVSEVRAGSPGIAILPDALLFPNPRTGKAWSEAARRRAWAKAADAVGAKVSLYAGTKHSLGTRLRRQGVPLDVIQAIFGHADQRSTELYAQLANEAVVEALGRGRKK